MPVPAADDGVVAAALARLVADEDDPGAYVLVEGDGARNFFVLFAVDDGRLRCEAVSNEYLAEEDRLDDEQMRALENLGWRPPEHGGQNWFRTFRPADPADYEEIVAAVRRVFADVYRLGPQAPFALTTSWAAEEPAEAQQHIRFASDAHREVYERVLDYTVELFGDETHVDPRRPVVFVRFGSAVTTIAVNPLDDRSSLVEFHSWVVTEVEPTPQLQDYLLKTNYRLALGGFALDGDDDIVFKHVLLGDTLTAIELQRSLATFVEIADDYDDEIRQRFGGLRAMDRTRR